MTAGPACVDESHQRRQTLTRQRLRPLAGVRVQVGRQRDVAGGREPSRDVLDVRVQAPGLLDDQQAGTVPFARSGRARYPVNPSVFRIVSVAIAIASPVEQV